MATKSKRQYSNYSKIAEAHEVKHLIGGVEYSTLAEMCVRMGYQEPDEGESRIYRGVHANRNTLLPKSVIYKGAYFYPVEVLTKAITDYANALETKTTTKDKYEALIRKLKANPELLEMLSSLVED